MTRYDSMLLAALRCAVFGIAIPETEMPCTMEDWLSLYNLAARQGVHTIIFDAFTQEQIPSVLYGSWAATVKKVETGNALMEAIVTAQQKSWDKYGIEAKLMKGQSLAKLYPVPSHRLCGDVDWYLPGQENWNKALALATRVSGEEPETDSDGDVHYTWEGVVIEHHKCFHHLSSPRNRRHMQSLEEQEDWQILNLIMLSTHVLKHAMVLGASLRQVCDIAVAYKDAAGCIDGSRYRLHLKKLGLMRWTMLLHTVLVDELGMPEKWLPFPLERRVRTKGFMNLLLRSRNLGGSESNMPKTRRAFRIVGTYMRAALLFAFISPKEFFFRGESLLSGRLSK